jgi:hypothetical protein
LIGVVVTVVVVQALLILDSFIVFFTIFLIAIPQQKPFFSFLSQKVDLTLEELEARMDNNPASSGSSTSTAASGSSTQLGPDDDASLLRFLVDMKGEAVSDKQLRDDLMTMLVAGHETTVKGAESSETITVVISSWLCRHSCAIITNTTIAIIIFSPSSLSSLSSFSSQRLRC